MLRPAVKRAPWAFYALAAALVFLFLARGAIQLPAIIDRPFFLMMQKAYLAFAFFVVVMFIGVFPEKSPVRTWLQPIRSELSIMGCLLVIGHIVSYLVSIGARMLANRDAYSISVQLSFLLSLLLAVLLIVLGATSFMIVRRHMRAQAWKRVQLLAYPFFLLTWVHILLYLLPPALAGSQTPLVGIIVYSAVFVAYILLRLAARGRSRKRKGGATYRGNEGRHEAAGQRNKPEIKVFLDKGSTEGAI